MTGRDKQKIMPFNFAFVGNGSEQIERSERSPSVVRASNPEAKCFQIT